MLGSGWSEMAAPIQDSVWDRFFAEFRFEPNYHERSRPAIAEPSPSITFDLDCEWSDEFIDSVSAEFLSAFRAVTATGDSLYFLDWQHQAYLFEPHAADPEVVLPVLPDGDYYIFLGPSFALGTFGRPWQKTLTVWGDARLDAIDDGAGLPVEVVRRTTDPRP